MFYCPERGVIFVHIPKSGGTSVRKALLQATGADGDIKDYERRIDITIDGLPIHAHQAPHAGHAPASKIKAFDPAAWDQSWTLAVVRNPFDRIVSMWKFALQMKATGNFPAKRVQLGLKHHDLTATEAEEIRQDLERRPLIDWLRFCDEWLWNGFPSWSGVVMNAPDRPYTRVQQIEWLDADIDTVLKLERTKDVEKAVRKRMGRKIRLTHENVSARTRDYRGYYCRKARAYVERVFADDIERFGYTF